MAAAAGQSGGVCLLEEFWLHASKEVCMQLVKKEYLQILPYFPLNSISVGLADLVGRRRGNS